MRRLQPDAGADWPITLPFFAKFAGGPPQSSTLAFLAAVCIGRRWGWHFSATGDADSEARGNVSARSVCVPAGRHVLTLALSSLWLTAPSRPWRHRGISYTWRFGSRGIWCVVVGRAHGASCAPGPTLGYSLKKPMTANNTEDEHITTLVHPDEYAKNVNQVASVYVNRLIFVKRKFAALTRFELIQVPMSECSSITYEIRWALISMIFGALLAVSIPLVLVICPVPAGTRVPVGAFAIVFIFGVILFRGPKRHRLTFVIGGKKFRWESKAGDFKYKIVSTQKIVAFARKGGFLHGS